MSDKVHIFGIRHHGPGSARSLSSALTALQPDVILIEGPPEGEPLLALAASEFMVPPIALLVYVPEEPQRAVFYPFARFSPEWCAIQFGLRQGIPTRFIDLPQAVRMHAKENNAGDPKPQFASDPLQHLAHAAGYDDSERWWENLVEHRKNDSDVFVAIMEAMSALRQELGEDLDAMERQREAHMRQCIRKALNDGFERISVICGAWHGPALADLSDKQKDSALLSGLPKAKVTATWVPWTNTRLAYRSGYGAGIDSPGWYAHLWDNEEAVTPTWMTKVAHLFRENDLDSSPSHVIEAVRLAETLAALREHALPTLDEMNEAVQAVFSAGSTSPLRLIENSLVVGTQLGEIPPETPMMPLQADITKTQKSLRLAVTSGSRQVELDLRREIDRAKSVLFHRMNVLAIPWAVKERSSSKGTFREIWRLDWRPEFSVSIIEASMWGNSVLGAAEAKLQGSESSGLTLSVLCERMQNALQAELTQAVNYFAEKLKTKAALANDVLEMMHSLPPLVTIAHYGDVRKTDSELVAHILDGLIVRIALALPIAVRSIDDNAATALYAELVSVNSAIHTINRADYLEVWDESLYKIAVDASVHGLISGRANRILLDSAKLSPEQADIIMTRSLSSANPAPQTAAWLEGFLQDSGQLLLLDTRLRSLVDEWVCCLSDETFNENLPLIRRTFSTFTSPERRQIGERIKQGAPSHSANIVDCEELLDTARAEHSIPFVAKLLGYSFPGEAS